MAIPSKDSFDECIEFNKQWHFLSPELQEELENSTRLDEESTLELLRKRRIEIFLRKRRTQEFEALAWLERQEGYLNALKTINLVVKDAPASVLRDDEIDRQARENYEFLLSRARNLASGDRFFSSTEDSPAREQVMAERIAGHFNSALRTLFTQPIRLPSSWKLEVLEAFREYFYSDASDGSLWLKSNYEDVRASAIEALQRLNFCLNEVKRVVPSDYPRVPYLRKTLEAVEQMPLSLTLPITRNDDTKRERLLVFRLFQANMKRTYQRKLTAIDHLMSVEGVRSQYEPRRLSRLCDEFEGRIRGKRAKIDHG